MTTAISHPVTESSAASLMQKLTTVDFDPRPNWVLGFLGAFMTFGIGPLVVWSMRLHDLTKRHELIFGELLQWLSARHSQPQLASLKAAINRLRFRSGLCVLAMLTVLLTAMRVHQVMPISRPGHSKMWMNLYLPDSANIAGFQGLLDTRIAWALGLSFAYGLHWFSVRLPDLPEPRLPFSGETG